MNITISPKLNIYPQNSQSHPKNISFEAIHIRQINPAYAQMRTTFERELETFTKNPDSADLLGEGVTSAVYKFKRLKDIVFKKSLKQNDNFQEEIEHLKMLPKNLQTVQKFVAQAFDDETGLFYLLSTKMDGKEAKWKKNPWTREHFKDFFTTLFELDINGIYHGDLHCGNILLDNAGKANLIDFQWTQKLVRSQFFTDKPQSMLPPFMMSENSQMFEMAGIPYYLQFAPSSRQGKNFLKDYLKEKAVYHQRRSDFLRSFIERSVNEKEKVNILKGINYEDAQSIMLRKPDDDVLKIEAKKLQFLSNFRQTAANTDLNYSESNYVIAPSSQLLTLSSIQELRHEIALQKKRKFLSSAKRDYLKYTEEYAKYWFDSVNSWIGGTFDMTLRTAENTKFSRNNKKFDNLGELPDLFKFVGEKYRGRYTREFNLSDTFSKTVKDINKETSNMVKEHIYMDFDPKIMQKLNEIRKVNEKLQNAIKNNRSFDVLNLSILSIIKNRELYSILGTKPADKTRNILMYQLYKTDELYNALAQKSYKHIYAHIWLDTPEKGTLTGYKGMYNFSV